MAIKPTFIIVLCSIFFVARSQDSLKTFYKEIAIITENDNYNFTQKDRYYTNGFFVKFNWVEKTLLQKGSSIKKIHCAEAGHMIYNPNYNRRSVADVEKRLDRPFAAWLYASYGQTKILPGNHIITYVASVGVMGPSARGEQIQKGYHEFMNLYKVYGWEYQLKNEVGVNAAAAYYYAVVPKESYTNFTLHTVTRAALGNTFTNASAGLLFKIGMLENENNSAFWNAKMGQRHEEKKHQTELIVFTEPVVTFQAYNATVQGGLFRKDKGLYVSKPDRLQFVVRSGLIVSGRRAALQIIYTYKQREAASMTDKSEVYGAFGITYRFR
jgi:hypothetical protein